jgi:hypothetical protein
MPRSDGRVTDVNVKNLIATNKEVHYGKNYFDFSGKKFDSAGAEQTETSDQPI